MKKRQKHTGSRILRALIGLSAALTAGVMLFLTGCILVKGVPNLTPSLFARVYNAENVSMLPAIVNTLLMTALTLLFAAPVGVFAAVYLAEYAKRGSRLVKLIRLTTQTLAGIPSIVFGLFGYVALVVALRWDYSLLAGAVTLAVMVLPTIVRTTEEALLAVPDAWREGSLGLGAGRVRTVFRITLPAAMPGVLAGVILAIGRIVGETAALIFTAGTAPAVPGSLFDSARTLSVHLYCLLSEGLYTPQAWAAAVVLLVVVIGINALSNAAARRLARK